MIDSKDFFNELFELRANNKIDGALDVVWNRLENWLLAKKFYDVNELLKDPAALLMADEVMICILIVTKPWSDNLPYRSTFAHAVLKTLKDNDATQGSISLATRLID